MLWLRQILSTEESRMFSGTLTHFYGIFLFFIFLYFLFFLIFSGVEFHPFTMFGKGVKRLTKNVVFRNDKLQRDTIVPGTFKGNNASIKIS